MQRIPLPRALRAWTYKALPIKGQCRIDKAQLVLRISFQANDTAEVPDVLLIERSVVEVCSRPSTVEEIALALADRWPGLSVVVKGKTKSHGVIRAEV